MRLFALLLLFVCALFAYAARPGAPRNLRCEYLNDPLAVQTTIPRFSWEVCDSRRGAAQSAYRILVASSQALLLEGQADLWDSGLVASDETCQIAYEGAPLTSRQTCWWKVLTYDAEGEPSPYSKPAFFAIGLLAPEDWTAHWISDPERPTSNTARPHNGYHSELGDSPAEEKWVTVDLGEAMAFDAIRLFPARPYDWNGNVDGFLFPVRYRLEASDTEDFAHPTVVDDHSREDQPALSEPRLETFPEATARYVRLVATQLRNRGDGKFALALAELQVLKGEEVISKGVRVYAKDAIENEAWGVARLVDDDLTGHPGGIATPLAPPVLRKTFALSATIQKAILYISALGLYEAQLNGRRVGDHQLAPEWTDYPKRVMYQVYDVTNLLQDGNNCLAAQLGDGWWAGRIGMAPSPGRWVYGDRPWLLAQLEVELADGSTARIVTDDTWRSTREGPVRIADLLDGEFYDANLELGGYGLASFDDLAWNKAVQGEFSDIALVTQPDEPMRVKERRVALSVTEPQPGVFVFDMGQNLVGHALVNIKGPTTGEVVLQHAEAVNEDGTVYTANLRGAPQRDVYLPSLAENQVFEPTLTSHGFRYVQVEGLLYKPEATDLEARVIHTSAPEVGSFECSNPKLNRLWENILWTQRGNLTGVPTDCPQRDERLGWMGDIQAFGQTACFNMDMAAFFTKFAQDMRDGQNPDGAFADVSPKVPYLPGPGAPAWGDAGVILPWRAWQNYADDRLLAQHFDAARRWVDRIDNLNPNHLWLEGRGADYNDWLNGNWVIAEGWPSEGAEAPREVFATAFFAHSTDLVARMADVLGRKEDAASYRALFEAIRKAFKDEFVDDEGRIRGDTQAGYALALDFRLLSPEREQQALAHLLAGLERYNWHCSTGIQTTHRMLKALSRLGRSDVVWRLVRDESFPGWLYMVDQGATTIWERWDGYVKGRGFQNPGMNSLNHWAFGAVGEWLYAWALGLQLDEANPGWKHFTVRPQPGGGLEWARGSYHSIRGEIAVGWHLEGDNLSLTVTLPANTTATLWVPTSDPSSVREGGQPLTEVKGISAITEQPGALVLEVGAGSYQFTAQR